MYEDYSVRQFMNAWFKKDFSQMSEEHFNVAYTEYVDTAGLYETDEFERVTYIHFLNNRINSVKLGLRLQRMFLLEFDAPYQPAFSFFEEFGHYLKWTGDVGKFLADLEKIENKEKKYISVLEGKIKELNELKKNKSKKSEEEKDEEDKEKDMNKTREAFVRTLNSLGKIGYKIDKDTTTVEELALMIKQQQEEYESLKNRR
jgi:hypothetical protein